MEAVAILVDGDHPPDLAQDLGLAGRLVGANECRVLLSKRGGPAQSTGRGAQL